MFYQEGGSGSDLTVPEEIIAAATKVTNIPLIVGGGIRTPDDARAKVAAGASFIVTGNIIESTKDKNLMREIASAVHTR